MRNETLITYKTCFVVDLGPHKVIMGVPPCNKELDKSVFDLGIIFLKSQFNKSSKIGIRIAKSLKMYLI